jgi:uncharacterized repeat protein (TIGR04076 family)
MANLNYTIVIEIFENHGVCDFHRVGEKFNYPEDKGKICQWLLDSMNSMIRVLKYGGTLPRTYSDTLYKKNLYKWS